MTEMADNKRVIWVIDDHQLFSAGMCQMLENLTRHHEIFCFSHPKDAKLSSDDDSLALIIMDFYIPDAEPLYWIMHFCEKYPQTPITVISSSISPQDKQLSLKAGASAYYPKHASPQVIIEHLKTFIEGGKPEKEGDIALTNDDYNLTHRQIDILIQLARGNTNKKNCSRSSNITGNG